MNIHQNNFYISTNKTRLDINVIYQYLSQESYWAKGRTLETTKISIENSLCFGVYNAEKQQVGFARVVTDYAVFAWLMDVFILKSFRGNGLGKQLITTILNHPELQNLKRWRLNTEDAHQLYTKFGFTIIEKPEIFMEKLIKSNNI